MKILNSFGRFHELKSELRIYSETSLYEIFCETVTEDVMRYMGDLKTTDSATKPQEICESLKNIKFEEDLSLLAFESILVGSGGRKNQCSDILELCETLEQSKVPLPLEIILQRNLSKLLENKIYLADKYALKIYKEELLIDQHFSLLGKIYLFESHESIEFFYRNVFQKVRSHRFNLFPQFFNDYLYFLDSLLKMEPIQTRITSLHLLTT